MTVDDTAALSDVVATWARAWEQRNPTRIISLWDVADVESWYLPADSVDPSLGSAVVGLIQRRCLATAEISYRVGKSHCRRLAPDLGLAFFELAWSDRQTGHHHDQAHSIGGNVRVTMVMRHYDKSWKIFHYAEAPLAPLLELQAYYEAVAADGLGNIPQRAFAGPASP